MVQQSTHITTSVHNYENRESGSSTSELVIPTQPGGPLHFENSSFNTISWPPKGALRKTMHNPNVRATFNYKIPKDLAQAPIVMSALEVFQSFPHNANTSKCH